MFATIIYKKICKICKKIPPFKEKQKEIYLFMENDEIIDIKGG